eukprot:6177218-Pleurochrysis_carterae.AAC.2
MLSVLAALRADYWFVVRIRRLCFRTVSPLNLLRCACEDWNLRLPKGEIDGGHGGDQRQYEARLVDDVRSVAKKMWPLSRCLPSMAAR